MKPMMTELARNILVVDDNAATRYATCRVLKHAGFHVRQALTGGEGVTLASEHATDLVVLDIDLPDISGFEVCRRIRAMQSTSRVRVVYLSASFIDNSHKVQGFEAGADGFLTHPVEPAVLNATVAALLRTRAIEVQLEQLLERERLAREEAERANRAKDDFLATLSHELRSPLTAIVGWAEVARIRAEQQPDILNAVQIIVRNARLQAQLISDLLDVSRIGTGNLRLEIAPCSLVETINTSVESIESVASERNLHINRNIDSTVGLMNGDCVRLHQIFSNMLNNAVKFSNPGGHIRVALKANDQVAQLVIEDEGQGIPPELLPRIFDRFWQADTTSRRSHGGLGLGLSIVKHLVELHGGTVVASSEGEGKGARFVITLSLLPASANDGSDEPVQPMNAEMAEAFDLSGFRVLIVDDDNDGREWTRHTISAAGAETLDVSNVGQALTAVDTFHPHVVVSDLAMPRRNGFDLLQALREGGHTADILPVIALSAFASEQDRRRALDASFQYFVAKPPERSELLRAVRRAVS